MRMHILTFIYTQYTCIYLIICSFSYNIFNSYNSCFNLVNCISLSIDAFSAACLDSSAARARSVSIYSSIVKEYR